MATQEIDREKIMDGAETAVKQYANTAFKEEDREIEKWLRECEKKITEALGIPEHWFHLEVKQGRRC